LCDEQFRTVRSVERNGASRNDVAAFARSNHLFRGNHRLLHKGGLEKSAGIFMVDFVPQIRPFKNGSLLPQRVQKIISRTFLSSSKTFPAIGQWLRGRGLEERGSMLQDDHVTVQEAAEYLRISIATVYRLLRAGKLTAVKVKPQGSKGSLRVSRKLVCEFSDGNSKTASLEQAPPPIRSSSHPKP